MALAAAMAAAPPPEPPPPPPPPPPDTSASDESFIEFLGADDVGDAGWWDYLKGSEPGSVGPPPPQGGKQ
jgi:hypothetical protein